MWRSRLRPPAGLLVFGAFLGGWQTIVDRMDTYGVPIPPEDRVVILDYLSEHLGP